MEATQQQTQNAGLAEAIREIDKLALRGADPHVRDITVSDGKGGNLSIPVAFIFQAGRLDAVPLVDAMRKGSRFAQEERLRGAAGPDFRSGTARHQTLQSFIDHLKRFAGKTSAVWAHPTSRILVSVFDYHAAGSESPAGWGRHRGTYACPLSDSWLAWGGGNVLKLRQEAFADLVDSRDRELCEGKLQSGPAPAPATLITLARNLEAFSHKSVKRERDPKTDRVTLTYKEESGVIGSVPVPPAFMLRIPVFEDAPPRELEVRLRAAVENDEAIFTVQIHGGPKVLREEFVAVCGRIIEETEAPVFYGEPETDSPGNAEE